MKDVAEALVGDHAAAGALVFEHCVGRGRGSVKREIDRGGGDADIVAKVRYARDNAERRVVRRGRDLVDGWLAARHVTIDEVRESAADIDADRFHHMVALPLIDGERG
jgi:hypothetical protein